MDVTQFLSLWSPRERGRNPLTILTASDFRGAFSHITVSTYNTGAAHTSPLHRLAILVFMSYLKEKKSTVATFEYLDRFYRQAIDFYKSGAVLDVIYAWYIVSAYTQMGGDSIEMAISHYHQYLRVFLALRPMIHDNDELQYLDTIFLTTLLCLSCQYRIPIGLDYLGHPAALLQTFEKIESLLQLGSGILPSLQQIAIAPRYASELWVCNNVELLTMYMQYYLEAFLFRVNYVSSDSREIENRRFVLRDICDRLMQLIRQLPAIPEYIHDAYSVSPLFDDEEISHRGGQTFLHYPPVRPRSVKSPSTPPAERDTAIALAYTFARLLRNMLDPNADGNEDTLADIYLSAIALCRLCASLPYLGHSCINITIPHRTLFWAGLILTKSRFPAGQSPVSRLMLQHTNGLWKAFVDVSIAGFLLELLSRHGLRTKKGLCLS
jgi:hypothetical protein